MDASAAERALAERRMREVNESWNVLRDPASRRAYDAQRRDGFVGSTASGAARTDAVADLVDADLVDVHPEVHGLAGAALRHLPWLVVLAVLGAIFVMTAYAASSRTEAPGPAAGTAGAGDCVDVEPGPRTTVVPCDGPHELEIVTRVADAADCPTGTEVRKLAADGRYDCVRET